MNPDPEAGPPPDDLRGKRLLVVMGSYRSKRHIYERARELGVRLVVVDGPGHWMKSCSGPGELIERLLVVNLEPFATFVERASAAVKREDLSFDGIGTIDGFAGGFTARIAVALGVPFHAIEAADLARDKHRAREAYAEAGVPGPRFARIGSAQDLAIAAERVGFPAVLKPVTGVGSVQAHRVSDFSGLVVRHAEIMARVQELRAADAGDVNSDRGWQDLMWSSGSDLVLESWIEGPKFDVDLLLDRGDVVYAHVTDDVELCGLRDVQRVAPSALDLSTELELIEFAARCIRTLGFRRGTFNVEVKRTADGPRLIEVNGRLGGYSTTDIHKEVWGVDLVEQWLRASLGLPLSVREKSPAGFVAESLLPSPRTGTLTRDDFLDHLRGLPRVLAARPWAFAGDGVAGVDTGAPDWLGALLTRGETRDEALAELLRLAASIDFPVTSAPGKA